MGWPLVTFLEDVIDRLPPEYKTKKEKWLEAVKDGSMKRMELMLALAKEHKALFPEYQKKGHETALVMGGSPKMKCFSCGQWGHKSKNCPLKKSDGKSKDKSKGDKKGSSKKGGKESQVRCHHCKKLGHTRPLSSFRTRKRRKTEPTMEPTPMWMWFWLWMKEWRL
jgi:hypothetical protein